MLGAVLAIAVRQLDPSLPLPSYARPGDAGLDLCAREDAVLRRAGGRAVVPTGIAVAIPEGYAGFVQPRSGLALRHGVTCLNTPGLIDAGYRDNGAPGVRERYSSEYGGRYYAAFLLDPDGNNIEAMRREFD